MEFKELNEYDKLSDAHVMKLYVVHQVDPINQTLGQICLHFRVNKETVKRVNKMFDDNITGFKQLLIPCQSRE